MAIEQETLLAMARDGGWYKIHPAKYESLGPQDEVLAAYTKDLNCICTNLVAGYSVFIKKSDDYVIFKRIQEIHINTFFVLGLNRKETFLFPCYKNEKDSVHMSVVWQPPISMRLLFLSVIFQKKWKGSYLVAQHIDTGKTYKLPLPNIYPESK